MKRANIRTDKAKLSVVIGAKITYFKASEAASLGTLPVGRNRDAPVHHAMTRFHEQPIDLP